MKEKFCQYLINKGYSLTTPTGNPSTVYDYQKRIDKVCEWENCSWDTLAKNITQIVEVYDVGGCKEELGNKSHRAVINALKQYREFLTR